MKPESIVHRFRMAMAKHLGRPLSPEAAAQIEAEVFFQPDCAVDPARFEPQPFGGYTIQVESFRSILGELVLLHQAHWLETERYRHGLKLNPDYEQMMARERRGQLVQFTLRHVASGQLVGHLRMFLGDSIHTQTPVSDEDTLYLAPAHRGSFLSIALLGYAEKVLHQLQGPHEIRADSKTVNRADVLMKRRGFTPYAIKFFKFTGGKP
jgi:hypothetical protein